MASGSSGGGGGGRPGSGSKGFDFATDDILCSYDDFNHSTSNNNSQDSNSNNGPPHHSDPKDFQKSRISRSSVFPTTNVYSQPEDSLNQELVGTVDRTVKKYTENLMRFLEGISSRLSQLELYCYNLDKSIGEMRTDLVRDHGESESKLKSLEKHVQEVHRSVQILRDKQELAETQKELAKLQLAQTSSQEEKSIVSASESKKSDDVSDAPNTQLALALPSQITPQPSHPTMQQQSVTPSPPPPPSQTLTQMPQYYVPSTQLSNPQVQSQAPYLQAADVQYRAPQLPPQASQPSQPQANQPPQSQQYSQYQQWPQQVSQQVQPQPPPPMQPQNQIRAPTPQSPVYPPYMTGQPAKAPPQESMPSSMPMQVPFPGLQQPGVSRGEAMQYGYGGAPRPVQPQPPPPHMKGSFQSQQGDGYATGGSHSPMSSAGAYMVYDSEGGRTHHPPPPSHYSQGGYPPTNPSLPNPPPPSSGSLMVRGPAPQQFVRGHPYNELIDKLVSMGYRGDHVVSVIQRLEESGQSVDFNAVLDRLNGHSSGGSQRAW